MQFRLSYPVWVVRATDPSAVIQFDAVTYHLFRDVLTPGTVHSVSVADTQFTVGGRTRQVFVSWSGGQPRSFSYTATATPETLTVTLARSHQVDYGTTSGGTISGSVPSGTFVADGTPVILTATDTSVVRTFQGWAGDTVTKNLSVTLPMGRPYSVRAVFLETFNTVDVVSQLLNGSSALTAAQLTDLDQLGNNSGKLDRADFLAWVQGTAAPLRPHPRPSGSAPSGKGAPGGSGSGDGCWSRWHWAASGAAAATRAPVLRCRECSPFRWRRPTPARTARFSSGSQGRWRPRASRPRRGCGSSRSP